MKKVIFVLLPLLIFSSTISLSQKLDDERKELQKLVIERQLKFTEYKNSLEKRSGFFGNKTKGDIRASHDTLVEIVKMDNRIVSSLNRVLDMRNFEKGNLNYAFAQHNEELDKLVNATDTLRKQVESLSNTNSKLDSQNDKKLLLIYFLLLVSVFLLYNIYKMKKQSRLDSVHS